VKHLYSGKVRELYETGDGVLLLVATDRISAFDHVLETPIPDKGKRRDAGHSAPGLRRPEPP
jgi:phosphoribosylaminoimidazole-succinocarboxamide synthase